MYGDVGVREGEYRETEEKEGRAEKRKETYLNVTCEKWRVRGGEGEKEEVEKRERRLSSMSLERGWEVREVTDEEEEKKEGLKMSDLQNVIIYLPLSCPFSASLSHVY